jgi:hypothetical protein
MHKNSIREGYKEVSAKCDEANESMERESEEGNGISSNREKYLKMYEKVQKAMTILNADDDKVQKMFREFYKKLRRESLDAIREVITQFNQILGI